MHYYQFNIADYRKDTTHLTLIEHAIYRQLLDWYYLDEKPIPLETQWVIRRFPLGYEQVETILKEFFERRADGWHHERCDIEINNYQHNAEKNRRNGKLGGRPKKTQSVNLANPNVTQTKANQEPLTSNQEPKTRAKAETATATRLPADWTPSADDLAFCAKERADLAPFDVADRFRDYWISVPGAKGKKIDWPATWRNWVRNENRGGSHGKNGSSRADRVSATIAELTGANRNHASVIDGTAERVD